MNDFALPCRRRQAVCAALSMVVSVGLIQACVWGFGERSGQRDLGGFFAAASEGRALAATKQAPRLPTPPLRVAEPPVVQTLAVAAAM